MMDLMLAKEREMPATYDGDVFFSADVETDGPIPGPYSMLSFALAYAGRFDGTTFQAAESFDDVFYMEIKPISDSFQAEALAVNGLDRERLVIEGAEPKAAMENATRWVQERCLGGVPVLVAYPLSFDWSWLYWYFIRFTGRSPFNHSRCFDIKTAVAAKGRTRLSRASRKRLDASLRPPTLVHTHHAKDDAVEQARIFARVFEWRP